MADQETKETNHSGESLNSAITQILKKLEIIDFKYSALRPKENFNIFSILRSGTEEVEVHSRFIAELLSPKGSHGMSDAFLQLFIEEVVVDAFEEDVLIDSTASAVVPTEKSLGRVPRDKSRGGKIDLIIENIGKNEIIIENKIYAGDQHKQLWRYRNHYPNAHIFYLTLDGHEPSDDSLGDLDGSSIANISYADEVSRWLERCIEKSATFPTLRESIVQYKNLIDRLTGGTVVAEEKAEVLNVLQEGDNAKWAHKIVANWNHLRWHTEWEYWEALERRAGDAGFTIAPDFKYSRDRLNGVIHRTRKRNPWYGLRFDIAKYKNKSVVIAVERGFGNVIFGIPEKDEDRRKELAPCFSGGKTNQWWAYYAGFIPAINFESFGNMGDGRRTLDLCNPDEREKIVDAHWQQMSRFIDDVRAKLATKS